MLLAELKGRRPRQAGKAKLMYREGIRTLSREKDVIVLPDRGDLQLYRLQPNWNQFIARFDYSTVWFGGTDENPFLVSIDDTPFAEYCKRGPVGFYRSLVPVNLRHPYKRQGDIFAVSIPFTWKEIIKFYNYTQNGRTEVVDFQRDDRGGGLLGTRHQLTGRVLSRTVELPEIAEGNWNNRIWLTLAEGTVIAPDHTDMILRGVHAIVQTQHLREPQRAD